MTERHDITFRQADDRPNPPDLLQQIVEDVKKLVPITTGAAGDYVKGKGLQEIVKAQQISAEIYHKIAQIHIERERLIQESEQAILNVQLQDKRDRAEHIERMHELATQRLREKTHALREIVDCIKSLREQGIDVSLELIKKLEKAASDLLEGDVL